MNVLFITLAHISGISERGIYTDLMRKFRNEGHNIYIVTPRERKYKIGTSLRKNEGVNILGVRTLNVTKTNLVEKGIGLMLIEKQFLYAIKKFFDGVHFDLILYTTPPITFPNLIAYLRKMHSTAMTYLLLKDIFPQNAVDLGLFSKKSFLYKYYRKKELKIYELSDHIGCMSPANVDFVLKNNPMLNPSKLEVNPNSIEVQFGLDSADKDKLRRMYDIPTDKIVFVYGGNLGKPQGIDFLISILESNRDNKNVFFLIVGSGTEYSKIKSYLDANSLQSVRIFEYMPKPEYERLLACCDVGLIFLDKRFTIPNYPSRLLSYLQNKMPILAATDKNTDIGRIAEDNGYGFWCESGDLNTFNVLLQKYVHVDRRQMGEKGFQFLLDNYQVDNSYLIIMKHFMDHV